MFNRSTNRSTFAPALAAFFAVALLHHSPIQAQVNIVPNGTLENVDPSNSARPMYWEYNKWGSATNAAFVWLAKTNGNHTIHTQVFSGTGTLPCTSGDAKWWTKPFKIYSGGGTYTVSSQYRSTVSSQMLILANLSSGGTMYVWVADLKPSSNWTTLTKTVSLPVATTTVRIMHKICSSGWLETDNYALYKGTSPAPVKDAGIPSPDTIWPPPILDVGTTPTLDAANSGGVISVVFDDGWLSVYKNALTVLKKQSIRATHFIHADYVDKVGYQADYMTSTQLKEFHALGHEIGSHAWDKEWADKNEYLDAAKLDAQLQKSLNKLKGFGFDVKGFAPPGGEGIDNAAVLAKIKQYYKYQRTILEGHNTKPYAPYRLVSRTVLRTTTLKTLESWVAAAKAQKAWLILLYHRIKTPAKYETEVTPLDFIDQLGVIKKSGLPITPIGEVLAIWKPPAGLKLDSGSSSTSDSSTTPVTDLGGNPWGDFTLPYPGPDAGFPAFDANTRDQNIYSMPRPWALEDDGICSLSGSTDSLPGLAIILLVGLALRRRRR